jgi:hypothetical protein
MKDRYEEKARRELKEWLLKMSKRPSFSNRLTKKFQTRVNNIIPDKVHQVITEAIKNMVKAVLIGSEFTSSSPLTNILLFNREQLVHDKINYYKKTAAISGAGTGAGGLLLGLADFPILLSLKIKFLFEIASIYGFDVRDYKERLYILYIFEMTFSSDERSKEIYRLLLNWNSYIEKLPENINSFDWRTFQQEYRDYIDLAKMLQLVPGIGAFVGAFANYKLMDRLGKMAISAYRLRLLGNGI